MCKNIIKYFGHALKDYANIDNNRRKAISYVFQPFTLIHINIMLATPYIISRLI